MEPVRVTAVLDYLKEPWYIEWVLKAFAKKFKDCPDVEKAQKYAMRDLKRIQVEATDIGSEIDAAIKANPFCPITPPKASFEAKQCLTAYRKWLVVYQPESIVPCTRLYSQINGIPVTGEPDLLVDGVLTDIKCAARIGVKYWIQGNVYNKLMELNETIGAVQKVSVLRLDKLTASYQHEIKDYDESLVNVWCGLLGAYVVLNKEVVDECSD